MIPLRIEARMTSPLVGEAVHLDSLLMMAAARRDALPPLTSQAAALAAPELPIPIALSPCGRFYLCTQMLGAVEAYEAKYIQRRFPLSEAIAFGGTSVKRIATNAGSCKAFRIPVEARHFDAPTWYAVGDLVEVRALLSWITSLGRRRGVGHGAVVEWVVEPCESWGPGFPVLDADGRPLRHLPLDVPGLREHDTREGRYRPPYWLRVGEQLVACPVAR